GAVLAFVDVDELKRGQQQLQLQSEVAANMMEGAVLVRHSDETIVYANRRAEFMFGYEAGELLGKPVGILYGSREKTPEVVAKTILPQLLKVGNWAGELASYKKDGTPFWCYANSTIFEFAEHGTVWVAVHTDISEQKKAQERALQAERLAAIGQLSAGLAHES